MPNRVQGLPIAALSGAARKLAESLDQNPLVARPDNAGRSDGTISAAEVKAGLAVRDAFTPEEQEALHALATLLGIEAGPAPQVAPATKKAWVDRAPPPLAATELRNPVALGDYIYVEDEGQLQNNCRGTSGLLRYDPANDTWTQVTLPDRLRARGQGDYQDPTLTAFGDGKLALVGANDYHAREVNVYDPATKQWEVLPKMSVSRAAPAACTLDGKLYVFGGREGRYNDTTIHAHAEVYDPATGAWKELPPLPAPRYEAKAIVHDGKIFVIGGREEGWQASHRVDVFDPATNTWQDPPFRMPTAVRHPAVWVADDGIHVSGGETSATTGRAINTVHEVLNPVTGEVKDAPDLRAPERTGSLSVVDFKGRLFAMGADGYDDAEDPRSYLYEWAVPEKKPGSGGAVTIIQNNHNTNVDVDVHITSVVNQISNRVDITHIENTVNNISVDNRVIAPTVVDIDVLSLMQNNRYAGFFDPDHDFFLRTRSGSKPLVQVGETPDGRALVGQAHGRTGPAPRNRKDLFLWHPGSDTLIPFATDEKGQFAVPLPDEVKGEVYVFGVADGEPSQAAVFEVP